MNPKKTLVAFFSCSGVTERVAENIAAVIGSDVYEIEPEVPYTDADLNWRDSNSRSTKEKDPSSRPAIAGSVDTKKYDVIFLGFPIWWYVAPSIIKTFVESYDFSGKTIVPFATSGGSDMGKTEEVLRKLCPTTVRWAPGKILNGNPSKADLKSWIDELIL